MIRIGVNENVYLKNLMLNEKLQLEFYWDDSAPKEGEASGGIFASLTSGEITEDNAARIMVFGFKIPESKKEEMTREKKIKLVMSDIQASQNLFVHLASAYEETDVVKGAFKGTFEDTQIVDDKTFNDFILDQRTLDVIWKNMAGSFIKLMKPHTGNPDERVRLLLVRQSKDKHFSAYRKNYLSDNPIIESMVIPADKSKLGFTKYEKDQGLDNDTPITRAAADDKAPTQNGGAAGASDATPESVFGSQ